jgi:hypothetical protein
LRALADWLVSLGITTVAMESTGVYWANLCDELESRGMEVCLANARYVKNVPGRKSDVSDCQWIQQLHGFGLLSASRVAVGKIRELRAYIRQRHSLEGDKSRALNKMGKSLQLLNVKLNQVCSSLDTQVAQKVIRSIVGGERDAQKLALHHTPQMKVAQEVFAKGMEGNWKREHVFTLSQEVRCYDFLVGEIMACEVEIERCLVEIDGGEGDESRPKGTKTRQNEYHFDVGYYLSGILGVDITKVTGLNEKTALTILSETGSDLGKWKTSGHFTSWLGLSPRVKISGERVLGHFKDSVANRANQAFRMAAWSLHSSKCYLGSFYRKIAARKGAPVAIKATARKLAVIFWNMVTQKQEYKEPDLQVYNEKFKQGYIKKLEKQASKIGLKLEISIL